MVPAYPSAIYELKQGGFKLSVFGSDPDADHAALTKEARGRRVQLGAPEESLLLRKATGRAPHGARHRGSFAHARPRPRAAARYHRRIGGAIAASGR